MNKYYIPKIEEIHVGFKCEIKVAHNSNWEEWAISKNTNLDKWGYEEYTFDEFVSKNRIQVKTLDLDDLVELGGKNYIQPMEYYQTCDIGKYHQIMVWFNRDIPKVRIYRKDSPFVYLFHGNIRNINELFKILKATDVI